MVALDKLVEEHNLGSLAYYYEGESVEGPILQIGNTNSRYRFSLGVREFINLWSKQEPSHYCAIGIKHISDKIEKLGQILKINVVKIY